jgi:hypothetical protein
MRTSMTADVRTPAEEDREQIVDAEVVVAVEDPQFPENSGPWRLAVRGGEAGVEQARGADPWCPFSF